METTYDIPKVNLPFLQDKINKINKKAVKLGTNLLTIKIHEEFLVDVGNFKYEIVKVEVQGNAPKLTGWKFLATLDYFSLPGDVIVKTVPGQQIPESLLEDIYRKTRQNDSARLELKRGVSDERHIMLTKKLTAKPFCDHCHTTRRRTETFIVQHEITKAYNLGCSDYVKKPFGLQELWLRLKNIISIVGTKEQIDIKISGHYSWSRVKRALLFDGNEFVMSKKHLDIIDLLIKNIGFCVPLDSFRTFVWEREDIDDATIRAEINRLKKMLKEEFITNIKGVGYKIEKA